MFELSSSGEQSLPAFSLQQSAFGDQLTGPPGTVGLLTADD
jgi:hypothetical protein